MNRQNCLQYRLMALKSVLITLLLALSVFVFPVLASETTENIKVDDDLEIPAYRYPAQGDNKSSNNKKLIVWLPSEAGLLDQEKRMASKLAEKGIEVWMLDLHTAYFLPRVRKSLDQFSAKSVAVALEKLAAKTKKQVFVVANSRGGIVALKTVRQWQLKTKAQAFKGMVLISAQLFEKTPEPGKDPVLESIVENSNVPIVLIQPDKSPYFWKMHKGVAALNRNGSDVLTWVIAGARDRYYYRPDSTKFEDKLAKELPRVIASSTLALQAYNQKTRTAVSKIEQKKVVSAKKYTRKLSPYKGNPVPPELKLKRLNGETMDLKQLKGKVVLVNYWATWCPPCVHEMPSMQRLQDRYQARGFTIVAVNMAEPPATIKTFLNTKVKVDFPILLDSDGKALTRWKVFAFPTSYMLDKKGRIRYAVFGAIEWDTSHVNAIVEKLLKE